MKRILCLFAPLALLLPSCETGELNTGGSFDPLTTPGSGRTPVAAARGLKPGTFVRASMETAFFSSRPKGDATADKTLPSNTEMKVISDDGSYAKVELNSGEVGFVPSVLVSDQSAAPVAPASDAIQVYPPLPGSVPPVIDPNVPTIPPVIDPSLPEVPEVPPIPVEEPVVPPVVPPVEPAPLPPGNEAEDTPAVEE
jgi:hypothetical protein